MTQPTPLPRPSLTERIRALRDQLTSGLVERDMAVRLSLLAALSGEHLILVGPPGTAKSMIASRLKEAFADAAYFERLLTRFTVPEELFGPLSIKGLDEDRYQRLTAGYLPTASVAFLDEIFKANSAILNALLTLLNERRFDNGTAREDCPLIAVIGASNELPEPGELDALFDRFLLRLYVGPVSEAGFNDLLVVSGEPEIPDEMRLTAAELAEVRQRANGVSVPADVLALLGELRSWCITEEIPVSDRRWRKVVKMLKTAALTNGRDSVTIWDCWLLQHCLWSTPKDRVRIFDWYAERVGATGEMVAGGLARVISSLEVLLKRDQSEQSVPSHQRNAEGQLLYRTPNGGVVTEAQGVTQRYRDGQPLFLAPPQFNAEYRSQGGRGFTRDEILALRGTRTLRRSDFDLEAYVMDPASRFMAVVQGEPFMGQAGFSIAYISKRVGESDGHLANATKFAADLLTQHKTLATDLGNDLWLEAAFIKPAARQLKRSTRAANKLVRRLTRIRDGFAALPRTGADSRSSASAPPYPDAIREILSKIIGLSRGAK